MDVTSIFRPGNEDVRVVIAHSTGDDLGERTSNALAAKLLPSVQVAANKSIENLEELLKLVKSVGYFHVLVLIAHGNESLNAARLLADFDLAGNPVRLRAAEMAVFQDLLSDKLCLFGICHFGSDELAEAVCVHAGALACIAPKPGKTITNSEIAEGFSLILNAMQK